MLDYIRKQVAGCKDSLKREKIGFQAFFEFLGQTPEFYRVLNEAEMFSPKAFRDHMDNMTNGYLRALRRSLQKGELKGFNEEELEVLVCILLSARNYIAYHFIYRDRTYDHVPPWVVQTYMKFITGGFTFGLSEAQSSRRQRTYGGQAETTAAPKIEIVKASTSAALCKISISDAHLGATGAIRHPVLLELIEAAAAPIVGNGTMRSPKLLNLSIGFIAPTSARQLVAASQCDRRGDGVTQVSVRISESGREGKAVATGQLLFATPPQTGPL